MPEALTEALNPRKARRMSTLTQRSQFSRREFTQLLLDRGVKISMDALLQVPVSNMTLSRGRCRSLGVPDNALT